MATKTIQEQFNAKAAKSMPKDLLGTALGEVQFNAAKNRFEQHYTNGIIVSRPPYPNGEGDLIFSLGPLYKAAWSQDGAKGAWLGDPLDDVYEAKNFDREDVLVQRFENGVIWCKKDAVAIPDVKWLSWRDWHMISEPGDDKNSRPSGKQ